MAIQLPLLDPRETDTSWRLDAHTRELGLWGVAEARRALAAATERRATAA